MMIGCFMIFMKWDRLFFVLLSFEFMMLDLFFYLSGYVMEGYFFCFVCFCVMVSVLGLLILVSALKFFGSDKSSF